MNCSSFGNFKYERKDAMGISIVKAIQEYFTSEPYGCKVSIDEFKQLTQDDKNDLRDELIKLGFDVDPIAVKN